jgi:hypothetical protein
MPRRLAGLLLVALALVSVHLPAAAAAGGEWGAGGYSYVAGSVCSAGARTSPLVSWDVGVGGPTFLTEPVTSDGVEDSGAPPFPSVGPQQTATVAPGVDGFASAADIATYATLLSGAGTSGSDAQVAGIARQVMLHGGASGAPTCGGGIGSLLSRAAASAGPYTISLSPMTRPAVMGTADTIVATVRGGQGRPVPGLRVDFASSDASLAGAAAVTDGAGRAGVRFTVPPGSALSGVTITATLSATVGLEQVSVLAAPSATNPSGTGVTAIYPAPPVTVQASAEVPIDATAHPVMSTRGSVSALAIGAGFAPVAAVSGLRGHGANVIFTVYGPVSLDSAGTCASAAFTHSTRVAATTDSILVDTDRTVTATVFTPTTIGCYSVQASLVTTDAAPAVDVTSSIAARGAIVTVIAATARLSVAHPVVAAGELSATFTPARTGGHGGPVTAALIGPLAPGDAGTCSDLDWTHAKRTPPISAPAISGDHPVALTSARLSATGCYEWTAAVSLQLPGGSVRVPAAASTVLLVAPTVTLHSDQSWSVSPHAIGTQVTVGGIYGQPAHVAIQMRYVPSPLLGCRSADWTRSVVLATGPSTAVPGDATDAAIQSGATPKLGCYEPVPKLTLDANPAVTAIGALDVVDNALVAGIDIDAPLPYPHERRSATSAVGLWVTVGVLGFVELVAVGAAVVVARRGAAGDEPTLTLLS